MSDEDEINKINKDLNISEENIINEKDILNSDFFNTFENSKKIPEKKEKIEQLINYLKENKSYIKSLKEANNLKLLYEIILTNLIENNNNFIISQINLIKIISEQISNNENEEIKNDFITFFKKALPKLFDKFYLQNSKLNNNLSEIFLFILDKKILKYNDYFPLLENICLEEDEDYKINILNFILKLIKSKENIYLDDFPENIINTINKLNENKENENLKEMAGNIIEILNERKNTMNNNENKEIEIPNNPLSQQDSKLAFSSFIKKISKAIRNENLNKNVNTTNNNIKANENENINNIENKENNFQNIKQENGQIEPKIEKIKESSQEKKLIIDDNNIDNTPEIENKNDITPEKPKRIMEHIKRKKSNESSKKKNNNEINEEDNNTPIKEEKKENKEIKTNNNKKGIKTRISRSRKLGVMVKPKANKEKEKEKEDINNNNKIEEPKNNNQILVNKINNINQKQNLIISKNEIEKEEINISPKEDYALNNNNNEIIPENN